MTDITAHYLALINSPYPSAADKEHATVLLKRYQRMKRSRDKLKEALNGRGVTAVDALTQSKLPQPGKTNASEGARDQDTVRDLPRKVGRVHADQ